MRKSRAFSSRGTIFYCFSTLYYKYTIITHVQKLQQRGRKKRYFTHIPTQSVWDKVEEGIAQQPTGGETEQHLEQALVLVTV